MSQFIEMFGDPVSWQTDTSLPTLNDTVNVISGFPFDSEKFDTEGVGTPLIRIRDIQRGYSETFTTEVFDEQYRIKKYELLVGMDGMFDIARWQSDEAALNQRVCCLRMKGSENDTFIQYLVQPILKHIENGTNATTVKHISTKQINGIRVPIASHEQKNKFAMIANQADKSGFDGRKSQFIEMFGSVDDNPKSYDIKKVGDFAECFAGATPSTKISSYWDNGNIPWMSSGEVHKARVQDTDAKITQQGYDGCSTKMVPIHSIVIALAGQGKTRGTVAINDIELCTNQSLCAIVPNEEVNYEYLFHNLRGRYKELRSMSGDVDGRGGLNLKHIQSIKVIVPPMSEQMKFVSIARQADKSGFELRKSIDAIDAVIKSLINS